MTQSVKKNDELQPHIETKAAWTLGSKFFNQTELSSKIPATCHQRGRGQLIGATLGSHTWEPH